MALTAKYGHTHTSLLPSGLCSLVLAQPSQKCPSRCKAGPNKVFFSASLPSGFLVLLAQPKASLALRPMLRPMLKTKAYALSSIATSHLET